MSLTYLILLLVSISGLVLIDRRYHLAFWFDRRRTMLTLASAILIFIAWDLLGIALGIFYSGQSPYLLPLRLLPEFPVEELFFLLLLTYTTLITYRWMRRP